MKKHVAYLIVAILLSAVVLHAQQTGEAPFSALANELKTATHRWAGDKQSLSKIFDDERRRLGTQFESELITWLADSPEKHYWISLFLEHEGYLHGNKRLPELSLLIKQQGLTLVQGKNDDDSKGYFIGLSITAAILSDELGLRLLASSYKTNAETLLARDASLSGHIPAVSQAERRRYDEIVTIRRGVTTVFGQAPPVVADTNPPPHAPVTGGILNGRALRLPKPSYPKAAREVGASGTVEVRVVIDETGKVIYSHAISGPPELRKVSEDAAARSEFSPTKLAGAPVKVSGIIQYNFVHR